MRQELYENSVGDPLFQEFEIFPVTSFSKLVVDDKIKFSLLVIFSEQYP